MSNKIVQILQPTILNDFKCIGGDCEDNCCSGKWDIFLDKKSYQRLKSIRLPEFKELIDKHIKRNRNNVNESSYGKIKYSNDSDSCPFLTSSKLCSLQTNFGENYLCNVCKMYPRISKSIDGELERTLTVSCPIAAKMILMQEDGIKFENVEETLENIVEITDNFDFRKTAYLNKVEKYFWDIRIFCIQIIKSRDYEIWERLLILGLFLEEIVKCEKDEATASIPNIIEDFTNKITSGIFMDTFKNITTAFEFKVRIIKEIMDERYYSLISSERYIQCCNEMIIGLKMMEPLEKVKEVYTSSYEENYKAYISEKEYILENFIVNSIFINGFPFGNNMNIWDNYLLLVMNYSIINMLMIGMMEYHKEKYTDDHTIKIIQSFSKAYEHNEQFKHHIIDLFNKNSYNSMAYIIILLKN